MKNTSDTTEQTMARLAGESPSRLVVMIYDVAIDGLETAAKCAEDGDIVARFEATTRTADAIEQLHLALDTDNGGEVARNLGNLYTLIIGQLPMINLHNDAALARRLVTLLEPLRRSWVELDHRIRDGEILDDTEDSVLPVPGSDDSLPLAAAG